MMGRTMAERTRIDAEAARFAADRSGAAAIEYGLLMLIAVGAVFERYRGEHRLDLREARRRLHQLAVFALRR